MRRIAPLLALALLAAPAALSAQTTDAPLGRGTRVRVSAPTVLKRRVSGEVVRMSRDTLVVGRRDDEVAVPLEAVELLELSRGKDPFMGAVWGTGIGAVSGVALGAVACTASGDECSDVVAILALYGGGAVGAGVGLVAGALVGKERWRTMRTPYEASAALAPAPGGGVALSVSLSH